MTNNELQKVIDKVIRSIETLDADVAALVDGKVIPAPMKKRAAKIKQAANKARAAFDEFD